MLSVQALVIAMKDWLIKCHSDSTETGVPICNVVKYVFCFQPWTGKDASHITRAKTRKGVGVGGKAFLWQDQSSLLQCYIATACGWIQLLLSHCKPQLDNREMGCALCEASRAGVSDSPHALAQIWTVELLVGQTHGASSSYGGGEATGGASGARNWKSSSCMMPQWHQGKQPGANWWAGLCPCSLWLPACCGEPYSVLLRSQFSGRAQASQAACVTTPPLENKLQIYKHMEEPGGNRKSYIYRAKSYKWVWLIWHCLAGFDIHA